VRKDFPRPIGATLRRALARGLVIVGLTVALLLPGTAPAQDARASFERVDLEVGGRITEVMAHDLDGDGLGDLLVVRGREALIYFQGAGRSWPSEPNQRFRFHPRTILFDIGDLDGDGQAEIVLLQRGGLACYQLREPRGGGRALYSLRPRDVVECSSFLVRPVEDEVRRKQFLRDMDGDGDADLVVPQREGFSVLVNRGGGRFEDPRLISSPPVARLHPGWNRVSSQLFASYWFADPKLVQFDGAGRPEVVTARLGELAVFGVTGDAGPPVDLRGSYTIPDQKQFSLSVENPFDLDFTMPLVVQDLDRDGRVDVSSTHVGQGTTRLYRNTETPHQSFTEPVQSIRAKGVTFLSFYRDMDGDGLDDLILPRMDDIGVWTVLKVLVTRSVNLEVLIFFQREHGRLYEDEPDVVRELEIPVAINSSGDRIQLGTTVMASFDGDYDGDGIKDVLYRTDSDEVSVYFGARRDVMGDEPATIEILDVDDYRFCQPVITDLDGDGRDDVIIRYTSWDREGDRLTLLLAR
jgi:FG-GAP-like repeat